MSSHRIFKSSEYMQPTEEEPIRTVITQSAAATVVGWYVKPGQAIAPHRHPHGQDTWTILSGSGDYQLDAQGTSQTITSGDVVIAHQGEVHGVFNSSSDPLVFISVVAPAEAGYELL